MGSIPGSGRSLGGRNGTPLQYSFLEKSLGRGPWWATVHGGAKSQTQLSTRSQGRKEETQEKSTKISQCGSVNTGQVDGMDPILVSIE